MIGPFRMPLTRYWNTRMNGTSRDTQNRIAHDAVRKKIKAESGFFVFFPLWFVTWTKRRRCAMQSWNVTTNVFLQFHDSSRWSVCRLTWVVVLQGVSVSGFIFLFRFSHLGRICNLRTSTPVSTQTTPKLSSSSSHSFLLRQLLYVCSCMRNEKWERKSLTVTTHLSLTFSPIPLIAAAYARITVIHCYWHAIITSFIV